jgi:hypothetical protein
MNGQKPEFALLSPPEVLIIKLDYLFSPLERGSKRGYDYSILLFIPPLTPPTLGGEVK